MAEVFDFGLQQHKIKMDGKFFESNLFAVAGDTGRRLEVQLLDSDNLVQNTTGISLRLNADVAGQATYAEATLVDATKGLYELDLPNGMLIAPGNWQFQWQIIGANGEKLHSFAFMGTIGSNLAEGGSEATNFYLNVDDLKQMQEDLVNGTFNSEVLETNIAEKLNNLEEQYAPKLTEVGVQLDQNATKLSLLKKESFAEHIITVGVNKNFNSVTDAINSINDNSNDKRYRIKVDSGVYAERIVLKPYVGVEGVDKESVIFELNRLVSETTNDEVSVQSMVELHKDGCFIDNLTIKGKNFRYMVHSEFSNNSDISVSINNCHVEHNGNDSSYTWAVPHAWGAGLGKSNTKISTKNSTFIGYTNGRGLLVHDNASPTAPSYFESENSKYLSNGGNVFGGINLDNYSLYSGSIPCYVTLNNNYIQNTVDVTGTNQRFRITGGGNSMQAYYAGDWIDSTAGYVIKNGSGALIPSGTAVMLNDNNREIRSIMNGKSYTNYTRFAGFAVGDIPNDSYGRVCYKGRVHVIFNSSSNYLDEVMLDINGQVVKYDASTADRRLPIGQHFQAASATVGSIRYIQLKDAIQTILPSTVMIKGGTVVSYAWGGVVANIPSFIGQFAIDTVNNGIYFAKGSMALSDWVKIV